MLASTGRFTTLIAGAVVLVIISAAFFVVFDLNTALGSSAGLPVVEIGRGTPSGSSEVADALQQSEGTESATSAAVIVGSGVSSRPIQTGGSSQSSAPAVGTQDEGTGVQTDSTTREYVEEEVQVKGRRPDPKSEHPGRGVGLLKKSKD